MRSPLRIAWLGHHSVRAGDGLLTYSREMVSGLRARGVQVVFVHHGDPPAGSGENLALKSLTGSHRYIISSPRTKRIIADLLRTERIELVHISLSFSTSVDFSLPDLCHEAGVPVVATFHVPYDSRFSLWQGISRTIYRLYAQSLAAYDRVIIFSEQQKAMLGQVGVPSASIAVVPNGVDTHKYAPGASDYRQTLQAGTLIGYLGRIDPEKNVETLIKAFHELDLQEDVKLVIVGSGSDRRRLERRFGGQRVHFTGQVADEAERIAILRALDVFVLPSIVEGLSLSLLEAMACGVATVATDVGSDGEALAGAGLVLDPRAVDEQLRLALRVLLDFPAFREDLGRRARQRVTDRYELSRNLDRLLAVYDEVRRRPALSPVQATLPALVNR